MQKKINLKYNHIKNQQRFPISIFGWPLKEASEKILQGGVGWKKSANNIIEKHIERRLNMVSLSELYNLDDLKKWSINSAFVPWFSQMPLLKKNIFDKDYVNIKSSFIIEKLCNLINSIENKGFIENEKHHKNIIVYPIDLSTSSYYVRAGNHRVAVLSAMNKDIPCFLDDIIYLKPRDKLLISKYFWKFNTGIINKKYPVIYDVEDWPAVKSGVISKENGIYIKKLFCE